MYSPLRTAGGNTFPAIRACVNPAMERVVERLRDHVRPVTRVNAEQAPKIAMWSLTWRVPRESWHCWRREPQAPGSSTGVVATARMTDEAHRPLPAACSRGAATPKPEQRQQRLKRRSTRWRHPGTSEVSEQPTAWSSALISPRVARDLSLLMLAEGRFTVHFGWRP